MPNLLQKSYAPEIFFELPQYRLHTDFSKEAYAEKLAKNCFKTESFRTNLVREVFCSRS